MRRADQGLAAQKIIGFIIQISNLTRMAHKKAPGQPLLEEEDGGERAGPRNESNVLGGCGGKHSEWTSKCRDFGVRWHWQPLAPTRKGETKPLDGERRRRCTRCFYMGREASCPSTRKNEGSMVQRAEESEREQHQARWKSQLFQSSACIAKLLGINVQYCERTS